MARTLRQIYEEANACETRLRELAVEWGSHEPDGNYDAWEGRATDEERETCQVILEIAWAVECFALLCANHLNE